MWKLDLPDLEATLRFGRTLGRFASAGTVVGLHGDLSAGKTSFAQGVGDGLGIERDIVSPTFILMAEYEDGRLPLLHADAYRLRPGEAETIGFEETVDLWPGVALIEWADRVAQWLPPQRIRVELLHTETGRVAHISSAGAANEALVKRWRVALES